MIATFTYTFLKSFRFVPGILGLPHSYIRQDFVSPRGHSQSISDILPAVSDGASLPSLLRFNSPHVLFTALCRQQMLENSKPI